MEYSQLWEKKTERVREEDILMYFHAKKRERSKKFNIESYAKKISIRNIYLKDKNAIKKN